MKHLLITAAMSLALAMPVAAQDATALAAEYTDLPAVQGMIDDMFSAETLGAQFASSLPAGMSVTDAQKAKVGALMAEVMTGIRPEMETLMRDKSAEFFSAEELQAMIDFYSSDLGASILRKNASFFTATMGELNPKIMSAVQSRQADIISILQGTDE